MIIPTIPIEVTQKPIKGDSEMIKTFLYRLSSDVLVCMRIPVLIIGIREPTEPASPITSQVVGCSFFKQAPKYPPTAIKAVIGSHFICQPLTVATPIPRPPKSSPSIHGIDSPIKITTDNTKENSNHGFFLVCVFLYFPTVNLLDSHFIQKFDKPVTFCTKSLFLSDSPPFYLIKEIM